MGQLGGVAPVLIVREYIVRKLYVHEDELGSIQYYTKSTGQVFEKLSYDAWGAGLVAGALIGSGVGIGVLAAISASAAGAGGTAVVVINQVVCTHQFPLNSL